MQSSTRGKFRKGKNMMQRYLLPTCFATLLSLASISPIAFASNNSSNNVGGANPEGFKSLVLKPGKHQASDVLLLLDTVLSRPESGNSYSMSLKQPELKSTLNVVASSETKTLVLVSDQTGSTLGQWVISRNTDAATLEAISTQVRQAIQFPTSKHRGISAGATEGSK